MIAQYIANGLLIGSVYACLAVGFSLIYGVLNIIKRDARLVRRARRLHHHLLLAIPRHLTAACRDDRLCGLVPAWLSGAAFFDQRGVAAPIFISFTLTFGLDLSLNNAMIQAFTATPRSLVLEYGSITVVGVSLSIARLGAMMLALLLTGLLYWLLRHSQMGRAIIAVRMDRHAAALLGIQVERIYAITFGIGALMAAAAGGAMAVMFPITPLLSSVFLGKSFVICVLGGLGSVPGALVGEWLWGCWKASGLSFSARNGASPWGLP